MDQRSDGETGSLHDALPESRREILFYLPILLLLVNCSKDNNQEEKPIDPITKILQPTSIIVKQGDEVVKDAVVNNKITLKEGKQYTVEVAFAEDVELQKGEFLKMKAKNSREFYAEFYGKNANEIKEKVVFKKEGYQDFSLEIMQEQLLPKFYEEFKSLSSTDNNVITAADDKKTIWILNVNKNNLNAQLELTFLSPVILENLTENNQDFIKVEKQGDGDKYKIIVSADKLVEKGELVLPIYSMNNAEKGKQISEIIFKADKAPYFIDKQSYSRELNLLTYYSIDDYYQPVTEINMQLYMNSEKKEHIFIENINKEIVESHKISINEKGNISFELVDDIERVNEENEGKKLLFFDAYEGVLVNGKIEKKQDAPKREIFIYLTGY